MINLFRQVVVVSVPVTFDGVGARQCMVYMLFLFALKPAPDMKLWMAADSSESDVEAVGAVSRYLALQWKTSGAVSRDLDNWSGKPHGHRPMLTMMCGLGGLPHTRVPMSRGWG